MCDEHDIVERTWRVVAAGYDGSPVNQFHIQRLEWTTGVPRHKVWVYKDYALTQEQAHRMVVGMMGPNDICKWEV